MATDINGVSGIIRQQGPAVSSKQSSPASAPGTGTLARPDAPDDSVQIQSVSRARELAEAVRDVPVVDGKRVQAVRDAIASGEHQVDPARVAERLVTLESQLHPALKA